MASDTLHFPPKKLNPVTPDISSTSNLRYQRDSRDMKMVNDEKMPTHFEMNHENMRYVYFCQIQWLLGAWSQLQECLAAAFFFYPKIVPNPMRLLTTKKRGVATPIELHVFSDILLSQHLLR